MNRLFYWPAKLMAALGVQRVVSVQRSRFNPLRGFDPEKLVIAIDAFRAGYLGPLAQILAALEEGFEKYNIELELRRRLRDVKDHTLRIVERADAFRATPRLGPAEKDHGEPREGDHRRPPAQSRPVSSRGR